ncbi:class I SAM-dependent methyltransferase [Sporosarcina sp. FA9]|uniref:class I SAM-dependent methyltransferase n=1 Tax=Sporosarcina sp. FA9 TaxID=3413030 RepID=UPI003F65E790
MNEVEAQNFYQKQFEMSKDAVDLSTIPLEFVEEIVEQVGKDFVTVLELGAGNGSLSRGLSVLSKNITTVELVPKMVEFAKQFETQNVTSLCGSFYDIDINNTFDTILYMDGFGVGSDKEQLSLLNRIHNWLNDDGVALIDIYQPNYWKKVSGELMMPYPNSNVTRIYGYDETLDRMTDTWWKDDDPKEKHTQSLACYLPDEIYDLCERANLIITAYYPGGAMDFKNWKFNVTVPLSECLSYRIKIIKA